MQALPVTAGVNVFGVDYPVEAVTLTKRIGAYSAGTANIQIQQNKKGQPISGEELGQMANAFKTAILDKTDTEPNVKVNLVNQINFEGILMGVQGGINASGSASFNISFAEPNVMLNSMNLNCYPSDVNMLSNTNKIEVRHPFTAKADVGGSIASRILKLYEVAKSSTSKTETWADRVWERQREINELMEPTFFSLLRRSEQSTNPDWLQNANDSVSIRATDEIAQILFTKRLNLWQALMNIANQFNLIYVGDFTNGGFFKQLDLEGSGSDLTAGPTKTRNLTLGRSSQQAIGQVTAYTAAKNAHATKFLKNTGNGQNLTGRTLLASYPPTPAPANGKSIQTTAPSWFAVEHETKNRVVDRIVDKTDNDIKALSEAMSQYNKEEQEIKTKNSEALKLWCRDKYFLLRSQNFKAVAVKPLTTNEFELGSPAQVYSDISGVLSSVRHTLRVKENSGNATTKYGISYVGATT